jgi:molybdenum cofactor biosynthesis enzyme MoaA
LRRLTELRSLATSVLEDLDAAADRGAEHERVDVVVQRGVDVEALATQCPPIVFV